MYVPLCSDNFRIVISSTSKTYQVKEVKALTRHISHRSTRVISSYSFDTHLILSFAINLNRLHINFVLIIVAVTRKATSIAFAR